MTAVPLFIICPDCGKQVAHKFKCPKCCGDAWSIRGKFGTPARAHRSSVEPTGHVETSGASLGPVNAESKSGGGLYSLKRIFALD